LKYGANFLVEEKVTVKFHKDDELVESPDESEGEKENPSSKKSKFTFYGGRIKKIFYALNKLKHTAGLLYEIE
jgi:hypothetical protein